MLLRRLVLCVAMITSLSTVKGQEFPHQIDIRNLATWGQIKHSGTDRRSEDFNRSVLPVISELASSLLESGKEFGDRSQFRLDQDKLYTTSRTPYPVRVYFIAEGAGYQNSIGLSLNYAGSTQRGDMRLVFPNASMPIQDVDFRSRNFGQRRNDAPLLPGDFVDIGTLPAGVQLDFFIVQDGARGGSRWVFTNHDAKNPDEYQHVISYVIPDSPYLLIGYEDLWKGGDKDYEDVLIVVDLGRDNIMSLIDASGLPN